MKYVLDSNHQMSHRFLIPLLFLVACLTFAGEGDDAQPASSDESSTPTPRRNPYPYQFFHPKEPFYAAPQANLNNLSPGWPTYPFSYPAYVWTPTSCWMPNRNLWNWGYFPVIEPPWSWYPGSIYVLGPGPYYPCRPPPPPQRNVIHLGSVTITWR
jgi:hypothetical protein